MDEQEFWTLIQAAKVTAGRNVDARPKALELQLSLLGQQTIQAFQRQYDKMILRAHRWDLWGAAYLMNGGCSDDGFRYFRDWLISEGREAYEAALANPDSLASFPRREYFDLELFGYAASKAFRAQGGGELERDFSGEFAKPAGSEWSEAELPALFPSLAKKYLK